MTETPKFCVVDLNHRIQNYVLRLDVPQHTGNKALQNNDHAMWREV